MVADYFSDPASEDPAPATENASDAGEASPAKTVDNAGVFVPDEPPTVTVYYDGGSYRWRHGNAVSPKHYLSRSQAEHGARKVCPAATIIHEPKAEPRKTAKDFDAAMRKRRQKTRAGESQSVDDAIRNATVTHKRDTSKPLPKSKRGRVGVRSRGSEKVERAAAHWLPSAGHIAYDGNGIVWEYVLRTTENGSVDVWRAAATPDLPESGIREFDQVVCTGASAAGELIKRATGKKPRAIGLTLRPRNPATPRKASEPKPKRASLLNAAAAVLADAKEPMQTRAIVEAAVERGLWKPGAGKTPHATLNAAMLREIRNKGAESRFKKVARGMFAAAKVES
ncbi:MAG: hypothetical protein D6744_16470 [Planctomycetota bacterium]|nr:MAG: hypothetical protein D6744_16470 [Planctomycetota bacterium]